MSEHSQTPETWLDSHIEQVLAEGTVEVEVFVRSLSPPLGIRKRQEDLLGDLSELESAGLVDSFTVNLWGSEICLCDVCTDDGVAESMLETVRAFEDWASGEGVELPFERRTVESMITETTVRDLEVPSICLAVYTDSGLRGVVPCTVAGEQIPVSDYVTALGQQVLVEAGPDQNIAQI